MAVVEAPPARAPRVGLLASSPSPPAGESDRWTDNLTYRPESYGPVDGVQILPACPPGTNDMGDPTARVLGNVSYTPYAVVVEDACTTMGGATLADDKARVRRWLDQGESYAIARELWLGTAAVANGWTANPYLIRAGSAADPLTIVQATAVAARRAFSAIEQALGDWLHGQTGMIHVPRALVPLLPTVDGDATTGILRTKSGHLVVPDAGYPGPGVAGSQPAGQAAPAATAGWIFGTADVVVRRSEPFVVPDADAQAVRTSTNTRIVRAYRLVAAPLDPGRFAALVDYTAA